MSFGISELVIIYYPRQHEPVFPNDF